MNSQKLFVFAVLTYNHSKYIIEHLESIKFLIRTYGERYRFKLVIADDGSKDNTVDLAKYWISKNQNLFAEVIIEADGINRGTCVNYTKLWFHINSDLFKITAGDDVYSCLNLIEEANSLRDSDFVSGVPLLLEDGQLSISKSLIFHMVATDAIYDKKNFMDRMKRISVINTPSLLYNAKFLSDEALADFIRQFKVTEDFPMMIKIAETYKTIKFKQTDKVFVYYRRTSGSTYLIRGSDFDNDKLKAFQYMLSKENSFLARLLLKNRIYCYLSNNVINKKLFNLNYLVYAIDVILRPVKIWTSYRLLKIDEEKHRSHYSYIKNESQKILNSFD